MIEVYVKFVKRMYGTPDGDFSVFSAETVDLEGSKLIKENSYGNFSISGEFSLSDEEIGSVYKVTLEENFTSNYPNSYKLIKLHYEFPKDAKLQWEYLENSDILPLGILIKTKKHFSQKECILDIIVEEPERLQEVSGVGEERSKLYQRKVLELKEKALLFNEYGEIEGVSSKLINKLVNLRPRVEDIIKDISKDPFILIQEAEVGFVVADRFRDFYGFPLNDKNRILHGVSYYLNESFQSTGNTYDGILESSRMIAQKLQVNYKEVINYLADIQNNEEDFRKYQLKIFGKNITTHSLYDSELKIFKSISYMKDEEGAHILPKEEWAKKKEEYLSTLSATLSDEQDEFLDLINEKRISVLLGPGGAGKSWVIDIACNILKSAEKTYGLFAPTARAAKVMSDYTGEPAYTIHRGLLQYYMLKQVAPYDVLIVDEFSMVDSELAKVILSVMGHKTRLIVVGDSDQLQSVGPGNVLFDIVEYLEAPTVRLTKIFRQAEGNKILDYAQALRDGNFKIEGYGHKIDEGNIVFINENDDNLKQQIALKFYNEFLSKAKGDVEEVMLLSPINKGNAGRTFLNGRVQENVNPQNGKGENDVVFGANLEEEKRRYFRKGDYITVTKNEYEMISDCDTVTSLINGDLGYITNTTPKKITFEVEDYSYTIDKSEINGFIDHAWTITIHKSQGGQADYVIVVLPENSYFMLNSNMLYTALTRAKSVVYVIGDINELNKAADRKASLARKTMIQLQTIGTIEE